MNTVFFELALILVIAAALSILFRFVKLPSILAYILAGIIIGPLGFLAIENTELLRSMADIGVALLLFMVGLELRIGDLKSVGKAALITGLGQIVITSLLGFLLLILLGFSSISSIYIAIALTFSSTIIIVKLLADKRDMNSLYGKISVGVLLVQDLFAIIALIVLSGFSKNGGSFSPLDISIVLVKGIVLFLLVIYLSKAIFPSIVRKLARTPETLFLFSIAWAFGMCVFVSSPSIGFSVEIGGFLAGLALANSAESLHISSRARSLRDFFIIIFFVTLGMGMAIAGGEKVILQALILSAFVLIGKPVIIMAILALSGYRKRTSFLAGLTMAQISEFSLIIIFLGSRIGHVSSEVISLMTIVAIVSFGGSTYMIMNGNLIYRKIGKYLDIFEKGDKRGEARLDLGEIKDHIILAGVNRAGEGILNAITSDEHEKIIVVDFNPDVIKKLTERQIRAVFGDIADLDILDHIRVDKAKIVISTVSDLEDNLHLLKGIKKSGSKARIITLARDKSDALTLYDNGADYVVVPHITSGKHIAKLLKENNLDAIDDYKKKDLKAITPNN